MPADSEKLHQIEMKVSLMERDIQQFDKWCEKITESIEKLEIVNINLNHMITLHEQKLEQQEKTTIDLKNDTKELHSRITSTTRELHDKIDQVEITLGKKIDDLRKEIFRHEEYDKVKVKDYLSEVDKYKWMILGAAIAIGWIIGNVNLGFVQNMFK